MEYPSPWRGPLPKNTPDEVLFNIYCVDRFNFWAWVDERDAAQACERGLLADFEGAHPLFISDSHNWLGYNSKALVQVFFPHISESKIALAGTESLLDIRKAVALIGYKPQYATAVQSSA
jgi:hypothetical protein